MMKDIFTHTVLVCEKHYGEQIKWIYVAKSKKTADAEKLK